MKNFQISQDKIYKILFYAAPFVLLLYSIAFYYDARENVPAPQGPCNDGDQYVKGKCYAKCKEPDVHDSPTTCRKPCLYPGDMYGGIPALCRGFSTYPAIVYRKTSYDPPAPPQS